MELLEVRNLKTYYFTPKGPAKAVDSVSFNIAKGEAIGLVGESGCGKSTVAYSLIRLVPAPGRIVDGQIYFRGRNLLSLNEEEMRQVRWKNISIVFQGAMNALNPLIKVGEQIKNATMLHLDVTEEDGIEVAKKMFKQVGLATERMNNYPFEFSGGMKQRAMIGLALACNPDLIICDEPTTALDVTIQAQILELLTTLRKTVNMSLLIITHNLSVIAETCDKVAIMYAGKIVESSSAKRIFKDPIHPYTKGLLEAIPSIVRGKTKTLFSIPGEPPDLLNPPPGCRFHPRCPYAQDVCRKEEPRAQRVLGGSVECHFSDELKNISSTEFWRGI